MNQELISSDLFTLFGVEDRGNGVLELWQDQTPGFRVLQVTLQLEDGSIIKSNGVRCSIKNAEALKEMIYALFYTV